MHGSAPTGGDKLRAVSSRWAELRDCFREALLLRRAESQARGYTSEQRLLVAERARAAARRFRAAQDQADDAAAIVLLRGAIELALDALHASRDATLSADALRPFRQRVEYRQPLVALDISRTAAELNGVAAYPEQLDPDRQRELRSVLGRTFLALRAPVEARSVRRIRVERHARVGAALLLVLVTGGLGSRSWWSAPNVALRCSVTASSRHLGTPPPGELVDGRVGNSFGIHTRREAAAWVQLDLGSEHRLRRVEVENRRDGYFDDVLPLVVELSADGERYRPLARRVTSFRTWKIEATDETARYVRLKAARPNGYIALAEVRVFAR